MKTIIKVLQQCILILCFINLNYITVYGQTDSFNPSVPILLYHHIAEENPDNNEFIISPSGFYDHMVFLKNNGYECISLDDYYYYRMGIGNLPEKPVIITFDDGYYSNYQYAYPILKSLNMKATIFVSTNFVGVDSNITFPHFSWEHAKEMEESKVIDIQSHSHNHRNFSLLNLSEIKQELEVSKNLIETNLGKQCNYFAYPYGACTAEMQELAKSVGYLMQFTTISGFNTNENQISELNRITISNYTSVQMLSDYLSPFQLEITEIQKSSYDDNVSFNFNFNVTNKTKRPGTSVILISIYDKNNKCLYAGAQEIYVKTNVSNGCFSNVIIPDSTEIDARYGKIFCVNDFANLSPQASVLSFDLN